MSGSACGRYSRRAAAKRPCARVISGGSRIANHAAKGAVKLELINALLHGGEFVLRQLVRNPAFGVTNARQNLVLRK